VKNRGIIVRVARFQVHAAEGQGEPLIKSTKTR
jgi:hypothetical protein